MRTVSDYKWNAKDYAKHSLEQYRWAVELTDKLDLRGEESLLDIGSGDGRFTSVLADRLPRGRVTGIDSSAEMVAHATTNFSPKRFPNLTFQQMDARAMRFQEKFDVVFSNATLHWIQDHLTVLLGISRALRPGGRMLAQMGGEGNAADMVSAVERVRARHQWREYFTDFTFPYGFYGPKQYEEWLAEANLIPTRLELIPKDMRHEGYEGLAGWLRTTWLPYVNKIPPENRDAFIDEVVERYTTVHPADEAGVIHVAMIRLEVEASKPKG